VPLAHFPSRYYRHRRHTLDLNKFLRLPAAFKIIHRSIEGLVHSVIEVADRPRVHDTLRAFPENKTPKPRQAFPSALRGRHCLKLDDDLLGCKLRIRFGGGIIGSYEAVYGPASDNDA
jgi:hypothetical protein